MKTFSKFAIILVLGLIFLCVLITSLPTPESVDVTVPIEVTVRMTQAPLPTYTPYPTSTPLPEPAATSKPTATPAPPTVTPIPPIATLAPIWREVVRWEGKSIKNTETFHIPANEWRISWDTKPGEYGDMNFQIFIYTASGDLKGVAANVIGADKDSTIMRGAGDYYLTINTAQPYVIVIEAKH